MNYDVLEERYPDIAFYLAVQKKQASLPGQFDLPDPGSSEIIYFFGTDDGDSFRKLKDWLLEKPERALVYLEDDWGRLCAFLKSSQEILKSPQVHLKYIADKKLWKQTLEEMAQRFPCDKILCVPQKGAADRQFAKKRLELMRGSSALSALYSDVLYCHKLFANLHVNFPKLLKGFDANLWKNAFEGVPAIICGAGPSLAEDFSTLKREQALIIAGGSAIPALLQAGVQPHLAMALDPNPEELERLRDLSSLKAPLLCSPRLQKSVLDTFAGPVGYLYSATGGLVEEWLREALGLPAHVPVGDTLGREAFSVTTLAVAYAHFLGCDPIILAGVDLAYTGGKRYAPGVSASREEGSDSILEKKMVRKDKRGKAIQTALKWVMEGEAIADFAKKQNDRRYFNATAYGLPIKGFENAPLDQLLTGPSVDLRTKIEALSRKTGFECKTNWQKVMHNLHHSLLRCGRIASQMHSVSSEGKKTLLKLELSEEPAYDSFLEAIEGALEKVLERYIPSDDQKRESVKWQELSSACARLCEILHIH